MKMCIAFEILYFSFKIDQRCSSNSMEQQLEIDNPHHKLLLHCTCSGCSMTFYIIVMVFISLFVFIGAVFTYLKKIPSVNYGIFYESSSTSQHERINETVL